MNGKVKFKEPNLVDTFVVEYFDESNEKKQYFQNNGDYIKRHFLGSSLSIGRALEKEFTSDYCYFSEKYQSKPDEETGDIYTAYRINFKGYDILVEDISHEQEETFNIPDELFIIEE